MSALVRFASHTLRGVLGLPLIATATAIVAGHPAALCQSPSPRGQRVDDSRTTRDAVPPSAERGADAPLGSQAPTAPLPAGTADTNALPFRITVDGDPLPADGLRPEADQQRKVDLALAKHRIQIRFDPLHGKPALNVWTHPDGVVRGSVSEGKARAVMGGKKGGLFRGVADEVK